MSEFARYQPSGGAKKRPAKAAFYVRDARAEDLTAAAEIAARREGDEPAPHRAGMERFLGAVREEREAIFLVAVRGEEVVGFAKAARFTPPENAAPDCAPEGWYLIGIVVRPGARRLGVGAELTRARLERLRGRTGRVHYFANARNLATIDLHARFGFVEVTREFSFPGATFEGGVGILFACDLAPDARKGDRGA